MQKQAPRSYRGASSSALLDGDTITVTKDLKLKGYHGTVKMGTTVTTIRLADSDHMIGRVAS